MENIYEEVKEANQLIQFVAHQTNPIFSALKIYGTAQAPLYIASEIGHILDIKNIDRTTKLYTPRECFYARIRIVDPQTGQNVDRNTKLLTKHGIYRIMFDSTSPVGEVFRNSFI